MNNSDMLKIGVAVLIGVIIIVVIFVMIKKDNYEYPSGKMYVPTGTAAWMNQSGNGGQNIPQTSASALVTDKDGNIGVTSPVPIGFIGMWAGSITSIPTGWGLCDGSTYNTANGSIQSPDLTSKFVLGAGKSTGNSKFATQYSVGDTGGEEYHQLTLDEMPSHNHNTTMGSSCTGQNCSGWNGLGFGQFSNLIYTAPAGGDSSNGNQTLPHNNMPPYYALAYIIKCL